MLAHAVVMCGHSIVAPWSPTSPDNLRMLTSQALTAQEGAAPLPPPGLTVEDGSEFTDSDDDDDGWQRPRGAASDSDADAEGGGVPQQEESAAAEATVSAPAPSQSQATPKVRLLSLTKVRAFST